MDVLLVKMELERWKTSLCVTLAPMSALKIFNQCSLLEITAYGVRKILGASILDLVSNLFLSCTGISELDKPTEAVVLEAWRLGFARGPP